MRVQIFATLRHRITGRGHVEAQKLGGFGDRQKFGMREGLPAHFVTVIPPRISFAVRTDAARWDGGALTTERSFPNGTMSRQIYSLVEPNVLVVDTTATTVRGVTSHIVQTYRRTP